MLQYFHIIAGALHDYAAVILIALACVAVVATIARIGWDLAAMEQRQHDRHEAATEDATDERMAA